MMPVPPVPVPVAVLALVVPSSHQYHLHHYNRQLQWRWNNSITILIAMILTLVCQLYGSGDGIIMVTATSFTVGVLAGSLDPADLIAYNLSFAYANQYIIPSPHRMVPEYLSDDYDATSALFRTIDAIDYCAIANQPVVWALLGPATSASAVSAALVAASSNTPVISSSATSSDLSDKGTYPTFSRVVPPDDMQVTALANLCLKYGWTRVGIINTNDAYGSKMALTFSRSGTSLGVSVVYATTFSRGDGNTASDSQIADITTGLQLMVQNGVRIIALFCGATNAQNVMIQAAALGLTGNDYVFLGVDGNLPFVSLMRGALGTNLYVDPTTAPFLALQSQILAAYPSATVDQAFAKQYDSGLLIAYALRQYIMINESCYVNGTAPIGSPVGACTSIKSSNSNDQRLLLNTLVRAQSFVGAGGLIALDSNGDCAGMYEILNQWQDNGLPILNVDDQDPANLHQIGLVSVNSTVTLTGQAIWPNGGIITPLDRRGARIGDHIDNSPSPSLYILSYAVAVVGSWVSLILVEQAVALRVRYTTGAVFGWLCLSSFAAAIGVWAAAVIAITAIRLTELPDSNNTITFDWTSLITILVAWPLMLISYLAVIRGVHSRAAAKLSMSPENVSQMQSATMAQSVQNVNKHSTPTGSDITNNTSTSGSTDAAMAAIRKQTKCRVFLGKITDRWLIVGAAFATASMAATSSVAISAIRAPVSTKLDVGIYIGSLIIAIVLAYLSLFLLFHLRATQYRSIGAFIFGGAMAAHQFLAHRSWLYSFTDVAPDRQLSGSTLQLTGAIVTAVICFILIGLNVTRLKLSRDLLDQYLLQTQKKARKLELQIMDRDDQLDEQQMLFNLIHVMRPITRRNHFTLQALIGAAEAHQALYGKDDDKVRNGDKSSDTKQSNATSSTPVAPSSTLPPPSSTPNATTAPITTTTTATPSTPTGATSTIAGTPTAVTGAAVAAAAASPHSAHIPGENKDISMSMVMENVATLEIFKDAVHQNRNSENLAFWIDVQHYKRLDNHDERKAAAADIMRMFLAEDAPYSLNISHVLRGQTLKKVREAREAPSRKVFEGAEAEVRRLMVSNDWTRFVGTEAYDACIAILKATRHFKARKLAAAQTRESSARSAEISAQHNRTTPIGLRYHSEQDAVMNISSGDNSPYRGGGGMNQRKSPAPLLGGIISRGGNTAISGGIRASTPPVGGRESEVSEVIPLTENGVTTADSGIISTTIPPTQANGMSSVGHGSHHTLHIHHSIQLPGAPDGSVPTTTGNSNPGTPLGGLASGNSTGAPTASGRGTPSSMTRQHSTPSPAGTASGRNPASSVNMSARALVSSTGAPTATSAAAAAAPPNL